MAEALPRVIRIPRSDLNVNDGQAHFVLVHVESTGKNPLDLKLVGTDGESVFSVSFKNNKVSTFKDKKFSGNADEWDMIMSAILLGTEDNATTNGIEAAARLDEGELNITIQRRIEEITQKLGTINLPEKEEVVELYDWCGLSIQSKDSAGLEVAELKARLKAKEAEAEKVNEQLAQLVKIKNDHENDMIEKFSLLLNEKKLKIRDQQRLLASANVDPSKAAAVEQSREPGPAGPSKARKRKAGQVAKDDSDSDGGFENMDVDGQEERTDSEGDTRQTPDRESTADAESEDEAPRPPTRTPVSDTKAPESSATAEGSGAEVLPPKRELPFSKKPASKKAAPKKAAPTGDSETESDNDEL